MSKRSLLVVVAVIIMATAGLIYLSLRKASLPSDQSRFCTIPVNAALIIESHQIPEFLNGLLHDSQIKRELIGLPGFQRLYHELQRIDSLGKSEKNFPQIYTQGAALISFHITGKNQFDVLYSLSLGNAAEAEEAEQHLRKQLTNQAELISYSYNGQKPVKAKFVNDPSGKELTFCRVNHYLIASFNSVLAEESIRQISSGTSLASQPGFQRIYSVAGKNVQGNLFFNHSYFLRLLSLWAHPTVQPLVEKFKNYGDWTQLDITARPNEFLLSGFTYSNDSASRFMNAFSGQSPQSVTMENCLPGNTSVFACFAISDRRRFQTGLKKYQESVGLLGAHRKNMKEIDQRWNFSFEDWIFSAVDNEFGLCMIPKIGSDTGFNSFLMVKTLSKTETLDKLRPVLTAFAEKKGGKSTKIFSSISLDKETQVDVYPFPESDLGGRLFGSFFGQTRSSFFIFLDNYLIFGPSEEGLLAIARDNMLKKTLSFDESYQLVREKFATKSNFYLYSSFGPSLPIISSLLSPDLTKNYDSARNKLAKFQTFAFQFRYSGKTNLYATDIFLLYNPQSQEKPRTIWESHLDTLAALKPKFVVNHQSQEKEILIQDLNHTVYLINKAGRILWQKKLNEPIISEISQVDALKNGKLQYLFSTRSALHLMDRNGNYLDRFPVKFPKPSTSPISVFDYEKSRDYRIFVACEDQKVYLYDKGGNIIRDWGFGKTEHPVKAEIQHFRADTKDYLIVAEPRRIYFLDRKGNPRFSIKQPFSKSVNNPVFFEPGEPGKGKKPFFLSTDSTGLIHMIAPDGKIETKRLGSYSALHWFDYQDMNADGKKDFIFADGSKVSVFQQNGDLLFHYDEGETISFRPLYYLFPAKKGKLGFVTKASSQLILLNGDGSLFEGFPLIGNTPFSIGVLDDPARFNLIVGGSNGFLYNYAVRL